MLQGNEVLSKIFIELTPESFVEKMMVRVVFSNHFSQIYIKI